MAYSELMGRVNQAVVEAIAMVKGVNFILHHLIDVLGLNGGNTSAEDDGFSFLDWHFEIAGYEKIFRCVVPSFAFFRIFKAAVPVGMVVPFSSL